MRPLTEVLEDRRLLAVLTVDTELDVVDANDGVTSLREAMELANINAGADTIDFSITGTINIASQLPTITDDVAINGPGADQLTIDAGNGADGIFNTGDGHRIFTFDDDNDATEVSVELHGLALTGGDVAGGGGAILNHENVIVTGSTISGNASSARRIQGGGIHNNGTATITNSTISRNAGRFGGGGIHNSGTATITNSTISGNLLFQVGQLPMYGGGIFNEGTLTITGSMIFGNGENVDFTTQLGGGGIFNWTDGDATITNSTISQNSANGSGGIGNSGTVTITNSTISENTSQGSGGGIHNSGTATITNSTISDNTAGSSIRPFASGGGISNSGTTTLTGSIVSGNSATESGNEISRDNGTVILDGYNLIGDTSQTTVEALSGITVGATDITTTSDGTNPTALSAILAPLADNAGPTLTHALVPGSPAIDAGDPSARPGVDDVPEFDQRGQPYARVADGSGDGTARIDIGSFEVPDTFVVDTLVDEWDGNFSMGDFSLREAIQQANVAPGPNNIQFDPALFVSSQTMPLTIGEIVMTDVVSLNGPGADLLAIDAQQNSRIFNITAEAGDFVIAGMTLTNGSTTGRGGAIRSMTSGNLSIDRNVIENSSTMGDQNDGGGVFAEGNVNVSASIISANSIVDPPPSFSVSSGGGIRSKASVTITDSIVSGNSARGRGGGVQADGDVTVTFSTISGNTGTVYGGGIQAAGNVTVTSSTISDNSVFSGPFYSQGGGISAGGDVSITSSTISGNTNHSSRQVRGGGIFARGTVTVYSSTISQNSTISFNSATGGGLWAFGEVRVAWSTIAGNVGGGIWTLNGPVRIKNSILAGDSTRGPDLRPGTGPLSIEYSLIGDNTGTDLVEAPIGLPDPNGNLIGGPIHGAIDPLLEPLADNGGPTLTHALLPGSPAIHAGDPTYSPPPDFDQRDDGFARVFNGRIDIGAYELQFVPTLGDLNGDQGVDAADVSIMLAHWATDKAIADLNRDGIVDAADAGILFANWTGDTSATYSQLPSATAPDARLNSAVAADRSKDSDAGRTKNSVDIALTDESIGKTCLL